MKYWTHEDEYGDVYGVQFDTKEKALERAQEVFEASCSEDEDFKQSRSVEIQLLHIEYNEENDAETELERVPATVTYEYYHGDYAEHNTMGQ